MDEDLVLEREDDFEELDAKRDELEPERELLERELLRELERDDDELNRELLLEKRDDDELERELVVDELLLVRELVLLDVLKSDDDVLELEENVLDELLEVRELVVELELERLLDDVVDEDELLELVVLECDVADDCEDCD